MSDYGELCHELRDKSNNIRDARKDKFETELLPLIEKQCDVTIGKNGNYIIDSNLGVIDYFPKSRRLLIRETNTWQSNGYKWIEEHIKDL